MKNTDLHSIYKNLLSDYKLKLNKSKRSARIISIIRLIVFIVGVILIYLFSNAGLAGYLTFTIALAVFIFLVLVKIHSKVLYKQKIQKAFIKINEDELTALSGSFRHFENGKGFVDSKHPYSFDIDIFGEGSLFQFLNRTSTFIGKLKLASRLRFPFIDNRKINDYQKAVTELKDKLSWRQQFQAIGISHKEKDSDKVRILQWINRPTLFQNPIFLLMVVLVPLLSIAMIVLYSMDFIGEKQLLFYFLVPLGISGSFSMKINRMHQEVSKTSAMLSKYGKLINEIETAEFSSDILLEFKKSLKKDNSSSANDIKKLSDILGALDSRLNIFAWFFLNGIMLWDILQIVRLERWQIKHHNKLESWFDIIAETEVIISLANFYYNNPEAQFPNIEKGEFILKADSGATKCDWILINQKERKKYFQTVGLNPYYVGPHEMETVLSKELVPFIENKKVQEVYYYSAGCSSVYKCMMVEETLERIFKNARLNIYSDMFGAARALFGEGKGIACILGTGSNSCLFDGNEIIENLPSLGYFFGDEGSGAHLGKLFIKDYLLGNLPKDIDNVFRKEYNYTRDNILDAIYNMPFPNRFLASFTKFYSKHLSNKYVYDLISNSFREFFINQVEQYPDHKKLPVSFTGSVAFFFKDILLEIASEFNLNIQKVLQTPIDGLADYHTKNFEK